MARATNKKSAGILLFRRRGDGVEVFLAHPGGPFWARKDDGAWTIPKGEFDEEEPLAAAKREFFEETGASITANAVALAPVKQKSGKVVHAFAVEQDFDPAQLTSNTFELEWPPRSGRRAAYPELDRAAWFTPEVARAKLLASQLPLLDELLALLSRPAGA